MRVALVPGVLALLPEYAGQVDPVPEVRAAALAAAAWLAEAGPVSVVGDDQGQRIGAYLLGGAAGDDGRAYLVVANGSARRNDTAPGYVDERAVPFDTVVEDALRGPDPATLEGLDVDLAAALLVGHPAGLVRLATLLPGAGPAVMDYADDPHGVMYWVMRWTVADSEENET